MAGHDFFPIYDIKKSFEQNFKAGPNKAFKAKLKSPKVGHFELLGYSLNSPFGAAACPTGIDSRYIKLMFDNGYDIVTTKTRRSVHFKPHPSPNIVYIVPGKVLPHHDFESLPHRLVTTDSQYDTLSVANSFGNNSVDPEYWVKDFKKANKQARSKPGRLLITSIVGTIQKGFSEKEYYQDFATTARLAKDSGAMAIEINFSCPNVTNEGVLCYQPAAVETICHLVKAAAGDIPIIAKLGYFPWSEQRLLEAVVLPLSGCVDAISAINTFAAPVLNDKGQAAMPGRGHLLAGLSGHAIRELGLDMTLRLNKLRRSKGLNVQIIGIGGVLAAADFQAYRQAGADAVLSATGAMWNPDLA